MQHSNVGIRNKFIYFDVTYSGYHVDIHFIYVDMRDNRLTCDLFLCADYHF